MIQGDLDRLAFAVYEAGDISTEGVITHSGVPWVRAKAALEELIKQGRVTKSVGHHHGDADLCHCRAGLESGLPRLTHWYSDRDE